jgi:hypothetical protein
MAICCYKDALNILITRESFEVDMTFQRIKDTSINEIVFAAFIPELNKGNSYNTFIIHH